MHSELCACYHNVQMRMPAEKVTKCVCCNNGPGKLAMDYAKLSQKKKKIDALCPLPPALIKNLDDWFRIELTYTSNAIEGNTLTRRETAVIIEKGLTVGGKC